MGCAPAKSSRHSKRWERYNESPLAAAAEDPETPTQDSPRSTDNLERTADCPPVARAIACLAPEPASTASWQSGGYLGSSSMVNEGLNLCSPLQSAAGKSPSSHIYDNDHVCRFLRETGSPSYVVKATHSTTGGQDDGGKSDGDYVPGTSGTDHNSLACSTKDDEGDEGLFIPSMKTNVGSDTNIGVIGSSVLSRSAKSPEWHVVQSVPDAGRTAGCSSRKLGRWDAEGHEITDDVSGPSKSHLSGSDCSPSAIRADQKSPSLTCRGIFMPDGRISEDKRFAPGFTAHQAMGKAHAMGRPMDNSLTNTICVHPGVHPGKQPITVPHTHTPLSLGSPGTEASASPCGGPLANANWEGFTGHRQLGSGSLGSVQSLGGGGSPVIRKSCVANMSPMNIFGNIGKLDFSAALRNASGPCSCCRSSNRMDMVDVGSVKIPYITVSRPFNRHHANFAQELWDAFGEDVVEKIFDEEGILPAQVKCLANAGLNHEFIAISTKHLVKLIVPSGPSQAGEAHEMEFLRKYHPAIAEDPSVCFPKKCFRLLTGGNPAVYDVVALEYHEGAMSVREITQIFERAPKDDKNRLFVDMYNLVGEQVPRVLRRYQNRHLRKHGDGKADNILVTSKGRIVMCDMGSTFNDSLKPCDRDEYLRSIPTLDAQLAEMKRRFDEVFRNTQELPDVSPEEELPQQQRNAYVLQEIRKLLAAQKSGPGASTPPMGMGGGLLGGIGAPGLFPQRPIGNQFMGNRFSATGLSAPFGQGSLLTANFGVAGGGLLNMPRSSEVPSLGGGLLNMNLGAPPPMMDLSGSMNRLP